jgi:2-octaprenyl-6-methoxyphenol hydroxylase
MPPTEPLTFDVAIAGGGIVGLTLAAALKDCGLSIALLEALPLESALNKPQAYALSLLSAQIWQGIGVWSALAPGVGKFKNIQLSDGHYPHTVPFSSQELGGQYLGYVGEHKILLGTLQDFLEGAANIRWFRPAQVTAVTYDAQWAHIAYQQEAQTQQLRAKVLVAADGARSQVRSLAGITSQGWNYPQACVAATIHHQAPTNETAFERFWATGPMGVLPLSGQRCQVVWTLPQDRAETMAICPPQDFLQQLQSHLGESFGAIELVTPRRLFPLRLMQAQRYVKPRLALIGDAAHGCHPVGGQGLNLGIRDAAALADVLLGAQQQGQDLGSLEVLHRYERWRYPENWVILAFTDFLNRFFSNQFFPWVFLRRLGLISLRQLLPFKLLALQLMTGLLGKRPSLAQRF